MTPEEVQANNHKRLQEKAQIEQQKRNTLLQGRIDEAQAKVTFLMNRHGITDSTELRAKDKRHKYPLYIKALLDEIDLLQEALSNPAKELSALDRVIGEIRIQERQAMYNV